MKKVFLSAVICCLWSFAAFSQKSNPESSLLWRVSGNNLAKPSYLFGTYHFLTNAYVDTLPAVMTAYTQAEVVVGELIIDSSLQAPLMQASILQGTTLKRELPDSVYAATASWFTAEAGFDIANLDQFNPISVMTVAMAITQQKYFPNKPGDIQLDSYFQILASKEGKKIIGLETIHDQIKALYGQLSIDRQAALLYSTVREAGALKNQIDMMNRAYISQDLNELQTLMYSGDYQPDELKILLDDRNSAWMEQLPNLLKNQSLFVAVGALHLVGENGLVQQLRKLGYTVVPVNLTSQ